MNEGEVRPCGHEVFSLEDGTELHYKPSGGRPMHCDEPGQRYARFKRWLTADVYVSWWELAGWLAFIFVVALLLALAILMSGCAVVRLPVRAYHFAYCDSMNADGVHCDKWATPCGTLDCKP
jgi:hypothetical protein